MPFNIKGECRNIGRTHFKKGCIPWNKGKTNIYSEETLRKMSIANKNRVSSFLGKHHSLEAKKIISAKISLLLRNNTRTKGKPWSELRRKAQETAIRKSFIRKPFIKNGKEYHPNWHFIRKQIYQRDGWVCQECGVHCSKKNQIQCHHIDYDTTNNTFSNLVTLCVSCHAKTNYQREDWIKYYKNLIGGRGLEVSDN